MLPAQAPRSIHPRLVRRSPPAKKRLHRSLKAVAAQLDSLDRQRFGQAPSYFDDEYTLIDEKPLFLDDLPLW